MGNTILVKISYDWVEVTPELLATLLTCKSYDREYIDREYKYTLTTDPMVREVAIATSSELSPTLEQIELQSILEENNHLKRTNEQLQSTIDQLSKSVGTFLAPV